MAKKNTLLYLDTELVKTAKRYGVNMSEITEAALRGRLAPYLSAGDRALLFGMHLGDLKVEGCCYELPFAVKSLRLKNVKVLEQFEAKFARGINLILGGTASGKSTVIRVIAYALGHQQLRDWFEPAVTHGRKRGAIELELFGSAVINYNLREGGEHEWAKCILLDEPLSRLDSIRFRKHKGRFLRWLKERYAQVILASRQEEFATPEVNNVIRIPNRVD